MSESESSSMRRPSSYLDAVTSQLAMRAADLDGTGLVDLLRLLVSRAEEIQSIWRSSSRQSEAMLSGSEPITKEAVAGQLLDALYQTTCLKWFVASLCKRLAEDREFEVIQKQSRLRRIERVVYSTDGEIESFHLEEP